MTRKNIKTFEGRIYLGLRKGYTDQMYFKTDAERVCEEFVKTGWCVTITPTEFIYTPTYVTGQEDSVSGENGLIIGAINYPRYPTSELTLKEKLLSLAKLLLEELSQERVTVVFTDETIMLERVSTPV